MLIDNGYVFLKFNSKMWKNHRTDYVQFFLPNGELFTQSLVNTFIKHLSKHATVYFYDYVRSHRVGNSATTFCQEEVFEIKKILS